MECFEFYGMIIDVFGMFGKICWNWSEFDGWIIFLEYLERSYKIGFIWFCEFI